MNFRLTIFLLLLGLTGCVSQPGTKTGPSASPAIRTAASPIGTELDLQNLIALLSQLFPNRDYAASYGYQGLLIDFRHFGVTTVEDARKIILENMAFAESEEVKWQALYGKNRKESGGGSDRSYYYNCVGMATHTLRKHLGENVFDDYELEGRPIQPPQTTTGSSAPDRV